MNNFNNKELQILIHLSEGDSAKMIGDKICLTSRSVEKYYGILKEKTNTYTLPHLIAYCYKNKILN